ncbi:MAG: cobalt transporter CbiM [Thermodesulfobacteriota bacterium]
MHIPDGYISPRTCVVFYAAMTPVWYLAARRAERTLKLKELPLLSLGAAFAFVIMMFNIPVPGGSSGHMVGAVVVAVALGPWAGVVAMTIALALQAFLFGDGGVTALGANAFNMAFLMSFAGYYCFRLCTVGHPGPARRFAAAAAGGYVAVNVAALAVGLELGIQPLIAHAAGGRPLYAPYPLSIAVPAMALPHLLLFGPVEALGTGLVVSYLYRTGVVGAGDGTRGGASGRLRPLRAALVVLAVLAPVGLLAPGTPWGEWRASELAGLVGYVPGGMEGLSGAWRGVLPAYGGGSVFLYIISALGGSAAVVFMVFLWGRLWRH